MMPPRRGGEVGDQRELAEGEPVTGDAVADGVADISAGYLTALLQRSSPGAEVTDVRAERIGTGQIGASYRLHLRGKDVPPTLVAKVAAEDRAARGG